MLVRYYGHIGQQTGYGVAASEMCMALLEAGVELEISAAGTKLPKRFAALKPFIKNDADMRMPDAVIVHTLPVDCGRLKDSVCGSSDAIGSRDWIAYTTWDCDSPATKSVTSSLLGFDAVWTPCYTSSRAIEDGMMLAEGYCYPVGVMPHCFDEDLLESRITNRAESDKHYHFLYVGDWSERKNVAGLLRAYFRAFEKTDNVRLTIVSRADPHAATKEAVRCGLDPTKVPEVVMVTEPLPDEVLMNLMRVSDCFVTATRYEAWNLPAFEALIAGCHVIHPHNLSGRMPPYLENATADFCRVRSTPAVGDLIVGTDQNGNVGVTPVIPQGVTVECDWADPIIADLAITMRRCALEQTRIKLAYDLATAYGRRAVGAAARDCIQTIIDCSR